MDMASTSSTQPTMNLIFNSNVAASSTVTVKDSDGNVLISFCANNADFISNWKKNLFSSCCFSS